MSAAQKTINVHLTGNETTNKKARHFNLVKVFKQIRPYCRDTFRKQYSTDMLLRVGKVIPPGSMPIYGLGNHAVYWFHLRMQAN